MPDFGNNDIFNGIYYNIAGIPAPDSGLYGQSPEEARKWAQGIPRQPAGQSMARTVRIPWGPTNLSTLKYIEDINNSIGNQLGQYNASYSRVLDAVQKMNRDRERDNAIITGQSPSSFPRQALAGVLFGPSGFGQSPTGAFVEKETPIMAPLYEPKKAVQSFETMPSPNYQSLSYGYRRSTAKPKEGGASSKKLRYLAVPKLGDQTGSNRPLPMTADLNKQGGANAMTWRTNLGYISYVPNYVSSMLNTYFDQRDLSARKAQSKFTLPWFDHQAVRHDLKPASNITIYKALRAALALQYHNNPNRYLGTIMTGEIDSNGRPVKKNYSLENGNTGELAFPMVPLIPATQNHAGDYTVINGQYKLTEDGRAKLSDTIDALTGVVGDFYDANKDSIDSMMKDFHIYDGSYPTDKDAENARKENFVQYGVAYLYGKILRSKGAGNGYKKMVHIRY